ncbi:MAG: ureidoglycolate lyase [Burkholderiaceae bacterium]
MTSPTPPGHPAPPAAARPLPVRPLERAGFARFGQVIDAGAGNGQSINEGTSSRLDALATVTTHPVGARAVISLFIARARSLPMTVRTLERHPFGSQAFMPLGGTAGYLVVVAPDEAGRPGDPEAFFARADQGVNFTAGTWHHPLIALQDDSRFLVVDRQDPAANLAIGDLSRPWLLAWQGG